MAKGQKRKKSKYPGLDKTVNSKMRQEIMDQDYISNLSHENKVWLSNFNEEYISGNFKHGGEIFHKDVMEKRQCYTRNNARNRCIFGRLNAIGLLGPIDIEEVDEMDPSVVAELGMIITKLEENDIDIKKFTIFLEKVEIGEEIPIDELIFLFKNH